MLCQEAKSLRCLRRSQSDADLKERKLMENTVVKPVRLTSIGYRDHYLYDDNPMRTVYMDHFVEFKKPEDLCLTNIAIERIQPAKLLCIGKYSFKRRPATSVKQKILEFLSDDFVDYEVDIQESHDIEFTIVTTVSGKTYCVKETLAEIEMQL